MCAKPFAYPLNLGHDITQTRRLASFFRSHDAQAVIKKIFSPLEWPALLTRLRSTKIVPASNGAIGCSEEDLQESWGFLFDRRLFHDYDQHSFERAIRDERSPVSQLSHHFAGRFDSVAQVMAS